MKRFMLLFIGTSAISLFTSCAKESATQSTKPIMDDQSLQRLHQKLENPDDAEDEHINDILFLFANGISTFSDNQFLMNIVKTECMNSPNNEVKYTSLVASDSRFESLLNAYLVDMCEVEPKTATHNCMIHFDAEMIRQSIDYFPNLTILNLQTANWNTRPIICVGAEIDDDDRILGLFINSENQVCDTAISESVATNATTPIIIVNNGTDYVDYTSDAIEYSDIPDEQALPASSNYIWHAYQIKSGHRYENGANNKSDLYFVITMHDQYNWLSGGGVGFPFGEHQDKIANISPNDVNNSTTIYPSANYVTLFSQILSTANTSTYPYAYITTFEKDWYTTAKKTSFCADSAVIFFNQKTHWCRMRYPNEWYLQHVCTYNLTTFMPAVNYIAAAGGSKMYCEFKRTN